jgi:mRNA-degrading endonuclease RelE of RelBE toxin-antitoxin system
MYRITWSNQAREEMKGVPSFYRPRVRGAILTLAHQAEERTRNRKPLRPDADIPPNYPDPTWEIRIDAYRVLYAVEGETVRILGVKIKGSQTTGEIL